ncbi:Hpt domain-containing protein [Kordiimonas pumila]|uniref:Hpt domain-containing protein n=1 Tax=Kordiimonas pumila TaxID=2161677 RepID=A0ABV7D2C0_9PROT|nr:Hpt domain-containing protein [Kordiimonas pumila]
MPNSRWDETIILDISHLASFTGGDEELVNAVLDTFCNNAPKYLVALIEAPASDWKASAHKLKGAARSIGAWRLAAEAERAEHMVVPADDNPKRAVVLKELAKRLEALLRHIRQK